MLGQKQEVAPVSPFKPFDRNKGAWGTSPAKDPHFGPLYDQILTGHESPQLHSQLEENLTNWVATSENEAFIRHTCQALLSAGETGEMIVFGVIPQIFCDYAEKNFALAQFLINPYQQLLKKGGMMPWSSSDETAMVNVGLTGQIIGELIMRARGLSEAERGKALEVLTKLFEYLKAHQANYLKQPEVVALVAQASIAYKQQSLLLDTYDFTDLATIAVVQDALMVFEGQALRHLYATFQDEYPGFIADKAMTDFVVKAKQAVTNWPDELIARIGQGDTLLDEDLAVFEAKLLPRFEHSPAECASVMQDCVRYAQLDLIHKMRNLSGHFQAQSDQLIALAIESEGDWFEVAQVLLSEYQFALSSDNFDLLLREVEDDSIVKLLQSDHVMANLQAPVDCVYLCVNDGNASVLQYLITVLKTNHLILPQLQQNASGLLDAAIRSIQGHDLQDEEYRMDSSRDVLVMLLRDLGFVPSTTQFQAITQLDFAPKLLQRLLPHMPRRSDIEILNACKRLEIPSVTTFVRGSPILLDVDEIFELFKGLHFELARSVIEQSDFATITVERALSYIAVSQKHTYVLRGMFAKRDQFVLKSEAEVNALQRIISDPLNVWFSMLADKLNIEAISADALLALFQVALHDEKKFNALYERCNKNTFKKIAIAVLEQVSKQDKSEYKTVVSIIKNLGDINGYVELAKKAIAWLDNELLKQCLSFAIQKNHGVLPEEIKCLQLYMLAFREVVFSDHLRPVEALVQVLSNKRVPFEDNTLAKIAQYGFAKVGWQWVEVSQEQLDAAMDSCFGVAVETNIDGQKPIAEKLLARGGLGSDLIKLIDTVDKIAASQLITILTKVLGLKHPDELELCAKVVQKTQGQFEFGANQVAAFKELCLQCLAENAAHVGYLHRVLDHAEVRLQQPKDHQAVITFMALATTERAALLDKYFARCNGYKLPLSEDTAVNALISICHDPVACKVATKVVDEFCEWGRVSHANVSKLTELAKQQNGVDDTLALHIRRHLAANEKPVFYGRCTPAAMTPRGQTVAANTAFFARPISQSQAIPQAPTATVSVVTEPARNAELIRDVKEKIKIWSGNSKIFSISYSKMWQEKKRTAVENVRELAHDYVHAAGHPKRGHKKEMKAICRFCQGGKKKESGKVPSSKAVLVRLLAELERFNKNAETDSKHFNKTGSFYYRLMFMIKSLSEQAKLDLDVVADVELKI